MVTTYHPTGRYLRKSAEERDRVLKRIAEIADHVDHAMYLMRSGNHDTKVMAGAAWEYGRAYLVHLRDAGGDMSQADLDMIRNAAVAALDATAI